jgi:hypothetical protein
LLDQEGDKGMGTVTHKKSVVKTGVGWNWIRIMSVRLGVSSVEPFLSFSVGLPMLVTGLQVFKT